MQLEVHRELIAPGAYVEVHDEQGDVKIEPIASSNAFKGKVFEKIFENEEIVGWARLMITNSSSESPLSIHGTFKTADGMYHIREISAYQTIKRKFDVNVASTFSRPIHQRKSNLIVFKDEPNKYHENQFIFLGARENEAHHTCGNDGSQHSETRKLFTKINGRLENLDEKLIKRSTTGCPNSKMILPIVH